MKTVKIAAAVICDSIREKKSIFATARDYGEFKGQWGVFSLERLKKAKHLSRHLLEKYRKVSCLSSLR